MISFKYLNSFIQEKHLLTTSISSPNHPFIYPFQTILLKKKSLLACDPKHAISKMSSNIFNFFKQSLVKEKDSYSEYK